MLRVYLDQNKWIDLARAATGHPAGDRYTEALDAARTAVAAGTASFPLDMIRYVETGKRSNDRSRNDVANVMIELSNRHTMAPGRYVLPAELDRALKARYGRPEEPRHPAVFGTGIQHVTNCQVVLPELDISLLHSSGNNIDASNYPKVQESYSKLLEAELLRVGPAMARLAGVDADTRHLDQQYIDHENKIASEIRARGLSGPILDLAVRASDLGDIRPAVTEAVESIGLTWDRFVEDLGPAGVVEFMDDLPTRHVTNVMRGAKLRQTEQRWELHDLNDILGLPVAAAYCDVVVTEKQWAHRYTQAKIEARYGTTILRSIADLTAVLQRAATA
ncbi:hypothetical protein [Microbacterium sp. T32]|uniref:hypothetical protein n=1 Tax=Microbacterium sp. T32 TaxID=1776083 RepID=UPI0007AB67B4|nr:hypothetical protein [Microbacterium sp. T32]KZE42048.1 hypothetical protein AVW09_11015 [Microbacterium sp. T32]